MGNVGRRYAARLGFSIQQPSQTVLPENFSWHVEETYHRRGTAYGDDVIHPGALERAKQGSRTMGSVDDRISGLNAGGDDYLVKPFAFGELSARVTALARRPQAMEQETVLRAGDLEMQLITRKVTRAGQEIDLLPREFALLEHLLRRKGRVQTRTMLLEAVWDISFDPMTNVVETHISRLRAKVDKPFDRELIQTVRGAGYRIDG